MRNKQLHLTYVINPLTFLRCIIVSGADPSHSKDMLDMGGVFDCYLEGGKKGWVFGYSKEEALKKYIDHGIVTKDNNKKPIHFAQRKSNSKLIKTTGKCIGCGDSFNLKSAVQSYLLFYTGGLDQKLTATLMEGEYRNRIAVAFEMKTFKCTRCMDPNSVNYSSL